MGHAATTKTSRAGGTRTGAAAFDGTVTAVKGGPIVQDSSMRRRSPVSARPGQKRRPAGDAPARAARTPPGDLLARHRDALRAAAERFVTGLDLAPQGYQLTPSQLQQYKARQIERLQFLLDPATTPQAIREHVDGEDAFFDRAVAEKALSSVHLLQSMISALQPSRLPQRDVIRLLAVARSRLRANILAMVGAADEAKGSFVEFSRSPLPPARDGWTAASRTETDRLGGLPGVRLAVLYRLDSEGALVPELVSGACAETAPGLSGALVEYPYVTERQGLAARAWLSLQSERVANCAVEAQPFPCRIPLESLGIASALAIPVLDARGAAARVIVLYSSHPWGFESAPMQQFAQGLQARWEAMWRLCAQPARENACEPGSAQHYRRDLFHGGFTLYVQPVVPLQSGRKATLEGLARLRLPNGRLVMPDDFLPLLSDAELVRLFRLGLDELLDDLVALDKQGFAFDVSLNIAASTLLEPSCPRWVAEALERHGIPGRRLTLELLETQDVDDGSLVASLRALAQTGVRLAMDDVGRGFSRLHLLSAGLFSTVKIDRLLVAGMRVAPFETLGVLQACVRMGSAMHLDVVAEGLEDPGMIEAAAVLGASHGQGYGLARPMPAEDVSAWWDGVRAPMEPGALRTYLGVVAKIWEGSSAAGRGRCDLATTLDALAAAQGGTGGALGNWLAQIRAGQDAATAARRVAEWLLDRMREESGGTPQPV